MDENGHDEKPHAPQWKVVTVFHEKYNIGVSEIMNKATGTGKVKGSYKKVKAVLNANDSEFVNWKKCPKHKKAIIHCGCWRKK